MKPPSIPEDEEARLAVLHALEVLDTPPEAEYEALVELAAFVAQTPIALVSLIDRDRQWFKARVGLDAPETARDISFCGHAVVARTQLVIEDAALDERFADNPLVVGEPRIRFYAGTPLFADGQPLGTLCVIDREPRQMSVQQLHLLELIAGQASRVLELRRVAAQLRESRDEARVLLETSPDPICVASFDGYFVEVNAAWQTVLGFELDELKASPFASFVHPEDLDLTTNVIGEIQQGGVRRNFVVRFRTADGGYRAMQFSATADLKRRVYIAIARDVTEAQAAKQALSEARTAAEDANRAKSVFLANMSHELRTPLNSVIGFSNVLLKNKLGNLQPRQTEYLERIQRNGQHLLSLLNDVLDLSKIEVGRIEFDREAVDLGELVREVHASVVPGQLELCLEVPEGLQPVTADRRRLFQIVTNLVGNAIKFTPQGRVTTHVIARDGVPVKLEVIDEGIGISAEALERIFEPFEQSDSSTERRYGGTGLGLAISRSLATSMGFRLRARSVLGEGATFSILFDDSTEPVVATVEAPPRRVTASPVNGPVLIVDDEAESRLLLESIVSDLGFPVIAVDTSSLAIRVAEAVRPHAVLLDLMMPGNSGFDILRAFEAHPTLSTVPVVIVSIVASENRANLSHAVEIFDKPLDAATLARTLDMQAKSAAAVATVPVGRLEKARLQLRDRYLGRLDVSITALREAIDPATQDLVALGRLAHRLRGSGGTYGFDEITSAAIAVEEAPSADAVRLAEELIAVCERLAATAGS